MGGEGCAPSTISVPQVKRIWTHWPAWPQVSKGVSCSLSQTEAAVALASAVVPKNWLQLSLCPDGSLVVETLSVLRSDYRVSGGHREASSS